MIRIFRVYFSTSTVFLILTETLLLFFVCIAAMFLVSPGDLEINLLYEDGLAKIAVAAGSILLSLYFQDLYTDIRVRSRVDIVQQWVLTLGVIFLIQALLSYTLRDWVLPRLVLVAGCTILLFVMPMWRIAY
ncbi:MAG TPA: hypothetical protein VEQ63_06380, partial [Bryobacteraceae bacterium]|nr:hypothetical protein [Bryobacteraceae bacterium]